MCPCNVDCWLLPCCVCLSSRWSTWLVPTANLLNMRLHTKLQLYMLETSNPTLSWPPIPWPPTTTFKKMTIAESWIWGICYSIIVLFGSNLRKHRHVFSFFLFFHGFITHTHTHTRTQAYSCIHLSETNVTSHIWREHLAEVYSETSSSRKLVKDWDTISCIAEQSCILFLPISLNRLLLIFL